MTKSAMLMVTVMSGMGIIPLSAKDAGPTVTVYLDYDARVPATSVFRATRQASRTFAKTGVNVKFQNTRNRQSDAQPGVDLNLFIGMDAPAGIASAALALAHPYRQDGRIEVFFSRIQGYKPVECRDVVLAYVITHEITHALQGINRHAPTGVMKENWSREDLKKIQADKLEFDPSDAGLIHDGIERRMNTLQISKADKMVR